MVSPKSNPSLSFFTLPVSLLRIVSAAPYSLPRRHPFPSPRPNLIDVATACLESGRNGTRRRLHYSAGQCRRNNKHAAAHAKEEVGDEKLAPDRRTVIKGRWQGPNGCEDDGSPSLCSSWWQAEKEADKGARRGNNE